LTRNPASFAFYHAVLDSFLRTLTVRELLVKEQRQTDSLICSTFT